MPLLSGVDPRLTITSFLFQPVLMACHGSTLYLKHGSSNWGVLVDGCLVRGSPEDGGVVVLVEDDDRDGDLDHIGPSLTLTHLVLVVHSGSHLNIFGHSLIWFLGS